MSKDKKNTIAVVMATYNGEQYLSEQLTSVLEQNNVDANIYCSDDNSTDKTFSILEKFKEQHNNNIKVTKNSGLGGPSYNFINALKLLRDEEYIVFCDQDDVWLPNKMSSLVDYAEKHLNKSLPGLVYCDAFVVDHLLVSLSKTMYGDNHYTPFRFSDVLYLNGGVQGASMMINRRMADEIIRYNKYVYMHDQLATCIAILYGNIFYLNQPLMLYRQHQNNVIGTNVGLRNKFKLFFLSSLINEKSYLFLKGFCDEYKDSKYISESKSTPIYLESNRTGGFSFFLKELFLGDATLHGYRGKLLIKIICKVILMRLFK
ncbi:MAG: glycosyltransferase family 2 protein [Aeromonas sp.]|uniref:glycosyltransferase family 2 protein n=1 Tax=Aeromonas caviae TaxID=648 RepID=UPI0029081376|nr:glycosyltransferase family 2 protein [Aeromonas caviae]MDU7311107.1 glycosyltransferase family 2 protein [Aeromonas sp.]MDX7804319.1 glycosyltransferase family 2 protein [Aeromonas caviae]